MLSKLNKYSNLQEEGREGRRMSLRTEPSSLVLQTFWGGGGSGGHGSGHCRLSWRAYDAEVLKEQRHHHILTLTHLNDGEI